MSVSSEELVSIVLPTRNRRELVMEAIESVLRQSYTQFELLVVDDNSTDGTTAAVEGLGESRIRVITLAQRHGVSGARNVGLSQVASDLVAFQDSDDVWHPKKLELQVATLRSQQRSSPALGALGCNHLDYGAPLAAIAVGPLPVKLYSEHHVLAGCTGGTGTPKLLVDRSVANRVVFDPALPAIVDRDFVYRSLKGGIEFGVIEEPLLLVRRGLHDHVANFERAATAYGLLLDKYKEELQVQPQVRDWYHYLASRELLLAGRRHDALAEVRAVSGRFHVRLWTEWIAGAVFGRRGLAGVAKLKLRPDWSSRCTAAGVSAHPLEAEGKSS